MDMTAFYVILLSIFGALSSGAEIPCDLDGKNTTCPDGYCCVRDEYMFSLTYCKPFGQEGDPCATKPSFFECACAHNYHCASNVHGHGHINSAFGTCHLQVGLTTNTVAMSNGASGIGIEVTTEYPEKATSAVMKALTTQRKEQVAIVG